MLAAPRRSAALPNEKGTHALFTVTNYSWETHKSSTELRLYNIKSKSTTLVATGVSDPHWVEGKILYLSGGDNGTTDFIITTIEAPTTTYSAGTVDGAIGDLKLQVLKSGKVAFVGTGKQTREGTLYNSEKADTPLTTARLYDSLYVRHWDTYVTPETNSLFYGTLSSNYGKYQISPLINALKGTHAESPIPPFGSTDNYDIGKSGILFSAKDPEVEPAYHTAAWTWFVATDFASQGKVQKIVAKGLGGLTSGPAFSPDGKSAAFLQMKETQYESDKNRIVYIPNLNDLSSATELFQTADGKGSWDRSPSALKFSNDGKTLLILADENARTLLFSTPATAKSSSKQPTHVTKTGHIIDMYPLSSTSDTLLLSGNSVIDNSYWSTVNFKEPSSYKLISSNSRNGAAWGLSPKQVSEIKYQGVKHEIQAWVITPSNFDKSKKYPLAYLIHGGPQGAWMDSWSTRWNPATWAEQGYVVVAPNPTGSTSFGKALTDEIQKNWGGSPYKEIELGFEYVKKNLPYVDTNNAIAAGASYGGYMINW